MKAIFVTRQPKIMNLKFTLFKLLPLITFITILFPTTNIARAASSSPAKAAAPTEAILKDDGHAGDYGTEYAAGGHNKSSNGKSKIVLSEEAIRIKFFILSGLLAFGIFAPEIFYRSKKNNQSLDNETEQSPQPKSSKTKVVEPDLEFLKIISEKNQGVDLFSKNSTQSTNGKVESPKNHQSA